MSDEVSFTDGGMMLTRQSDSSVLYEKLSGAVAEIERLQRERDEARKALSEIAAVLGPDVPDCCCDGCNAEMSIALNVALRALGREGDAK